MQKKTMGSFMAALRKANGYTQQQIADKLNVSNKTVSKWECDDGCPEISMLPAIAEIYGITVDELLRGEKANQSAESQTNNQKTEEQIKYLCEKAFSKFNNGVIISFVLCFLSLILAIFPIFNSVEGFFVIDFPLYVVFALIAFILCATSVVIISVFFNNLISNINGYELKETTVHSKRFSKCMVLLSVVIALAVTVSLSLVGPLVVSFFPPAYELVIIMIGFAIGLLTNLVMRKKYGIVNYDISPEKQKYRKKHTKITAILLSVMFFLTLALPFIGNVIDNSIVHKCCFADGVGYQYETEADAEREYYKYKNHIMGEQKIYEIHDESYDEETGEYILEGNELKHDFNYNSKKGYELVGSNYPYKTFTFKTEEEKIKFEEEYTKPSDTWNFEFFDRNVNFDDETLTISYKRNFSIEVSMLDILTVFLLFFFEALIIVIISNIIYKRKTKNL